MWVYFLFIVKINTNPTHAYAMRNDDGARKHHQKREEQSRWKEMFHHKIKVYFQQQQKEPPESPKLSKQTSVLYAHIFPDD